MIVLRIVAVVLVDIIPKMFGRKLPSWDVELLFVDQTNFTESADTSLVETSTSLKSTSWDLLKHVTTDKDSMHVKQELQQVEEHFLLPPPIPIPLLVSLPVIPKSLFLHW